MISKELTYEHVFTGEQVTETFHFHLGKQDIVRLIGKDKEGDFEKYCKEVAESGDTDRILDFIDDVVRLAVGKKVGDQFVKSRDFKENFMASDAYGELLVELLQNPSGVLDFFQGMLGAKQNKAALAKVTASKKSKKK